MYQTHFRLSDRPFRLTQDLTYYYGPPHQVPLDELSYSIEEEQGVAVLIGKHGTGKTTVLRRLLQNLPPNLEGVFLSDHSLGGRSLLEPLASTLGVATPDPEPQRLAESLKSRRAGGRRVVLLIDEAQALTSKQFDEVRFLTNLEHEGRRLLEIVLSGPRSLLDRLSSPELAPLRQRVAIHAFVEPLDRAQTEAYIRHRLRIAGAEAPIFDSAALDSIHDVTGGIPRLINLLCERSLVVAYATGLERVGASIVDAARSDLNRLEEDENDGKEPELEASSRILAALERIEEKQERILDLLEERGEKASERSWLNGLRRGG